jgi:hypothetical protein
MTRPLLTDLRLQRFNFVLHGVCRASGFVRAIAVNKRNSFSRLLLTHNLSSVRPRNRGALCGFAVLASDRRPVVAVAEGQE